MKAGGSGEVLRLSQSRMNFFDFDPDPTRRHTFWTLVIGAISQFFYLCITQSGVQRINSTPSIKAAKVVFYIAAPIYALTWILTMFEGVSIFAYFASKGCDPVASGQVGNVNQIVPFAMMELFYDLPGFPGLVIAALAAASLSTMSSGLCSLTAVAYEDFIKVYFKSLSDNTGANISKGIVVVFGFIAVGFAFLLSNVEGPLGQIMASFMGAIGGPENGLFLTSIFLRRAHPKAMVIATLTGVGLILWISCGQHFSVSIQKAPYLPLGPTDQCLPQEIQSGINDTTVTVFPYVFNSSTKATTESTAQDQGRSGLQTFYSISYMYFHLIGMLVVVVVGVSLSLIFGPAEEPKENDKVLFPVSNLLPSCLKKRCYSSKERYILEARENGEMQNMVA